MYQQDPFFSFSSPLTFFGSYQTIEEDDPFSPKLTLNMQTINPTQNSPGVYLHWFE